MPPQTSAASTRFSFEKASVCALIGTIVLATIIVIPFGSVPFLPTKAFVLAAGAIITLALFILARLVRGNVILPPVTLVAALWLPALAYVLSTAFSGVNVSDATFGTALESDTLGFMLVVGFLGTLAALAIRRIDQYRTFFVAAGWAAGFVAVVELLIVVVGQFAPNTVSPSLSIIGSFADLGSFLGLTVIGILLTLRLLEVSSRVRTWLYLLGAVSLFLLAVSNSQLTWILVALGALGLFVESIMKRSPSASAEMDLEGSHLVSEHDTMDDERSGSLVAPLVVLAVSLFFLIGSSLGGALASGLHVNVLDVRPSWASTFGVAGRVYANSPLFGSGPGTFGSQWLKYRDASLNQTVFWNIDFSSGIGFVPTSAITTGILGALAWLALFAAFLFFGARALIFRAVSDPFVRYASILSFVAATYLFAVAIFGLPGEVTLVLAFVFAGIFASTLRYTSGANQWGVVFARAPRMGFIIVFGLTLLLLAAIVAAYALVERYIAQVYLTQAATELQSGNLSSALADTTNSLSFAPSASAYQAQAQVAQAQMQQIAASSTMAAADAQRQFQSALSSGINAALTATRVAPNDYQNWLALGNLYATVVPLNVQGAYANAKTAYAKAAALDPTNPSISYVLAQLDIANKDNASAIKDLQAAIALKQDYTAAIFLLSQLEVQTGNLKDALSAAEAAAYFTPTDPNVLFQVGVLRAANGDLPGATQALAASVSANPQFANARYFLAAVYEKAGDTQDALTQLQAISDMSAQNKQAIAPQLASLQAGKNPFPANLLSATSTPVKQ